jgi:hypothetical protein
MKSRWFTAYRFDLDYSKSDATMIFIALYDNGLTPEWATEAPCKADPSKPRALLINLPKVEQEKFRAYKGGTQ